MSSILHTSFPYEGEFRLTSGPLREQPAAVRPPRPVGFTSTPTKGLSRAEVAAALSGKGTSLPATDENAGPDSSTPAASSRAKTATHPKVATPKAAVPVQRPTPKVATATGPSTNTPKPASTVTKPTAASAAKSAAKVATPKVQTPAAKLVTLAATPAATVSSCAKCTPSSSKSRSSLGGRTPTVTMTCRCEALDMLDNYSESVEASFNDKDVSLNTSNDKSSEMDTSHTSAGAVSSDGNQFGSPAAVGAPQLTSTLVFSATKLVPDLTGTSVLAAKSPKLRTPLKKTPLKESTKTLKVSLVYCITLHHNAHTATPATHCNCIVSHCNDFTKISKVSI